MIQDLPWIRAERLNSWVMDPLLRRAVAGLCALSTPLWAQVQFTDQSPALGLQAFSMADGLSGGMAAADCDDDGDVDLFVPNGNGAADQLYVYTAGGAYLELAAGAGLASTDNNRAGLWVDFDGDRDLDLIVAGDQYQIDEPSPVQPVRWYEHTSNLVFAEKAAPNGLESVSLPNPDTHVGGLCAGDVDRDGWLDLCVAYWEGERHLFLNREGQSLLDVSDRTGLGGSDPYWQPSFHDFDGDGWLDLFQAVDFKPNELWINQRDGSFLEVAPYAGLDNAMNDMGVAFGDYDNDGDHDLYITNIWNANEHNVFHENHSTPNQVRFREIAPHLGVDVGFVGWGTSFFDADRDGWLDLAETNSSPTPSRFWFHGGGPQATYIEASQQVGFDDQLAGTGLLAFDCDRDGDVDLLQACLNGPLRLLVCAPDPDVQNNHWLLARPRQSGPNPRAIGAELRLYAGELELARRISAGTSIMGQEPAEAHFGLAANAVVDRIDVRWPDGLITRHGPFAADQVIDLLRP